MAIHLKDSNKANNQDSFKVHSKIAETICEIIKNSDLKECSFNMGLFGNWGSGKSFIINRIEESLSKEEYLFLNIDVWKFIGNPLLRSILFDINKQLKEKANDIFSNGYEENHRELESILYYEESLKNEIPISLEECDKKLTKLFIANKPYWLTIFGVIVALFLISVFVPKTLYDSWGYWSNVINGLLVTNSNLLGFCIGILFILIYPLRKIGEVLYNGLEIQNYKTLPNFSPEQFERIFSNITNAINKNKKKLIIVFDNLDRCEPKYAYETLSTIKTFMDIKNCFYIVPCDDNAVKQYIANNYSILQNKENTFANTLGVEFFDKLFDTYIRIPILEEIDRDEFIEEQLKQITIYDELKDNIREIRQILYYGYKGSTPRQIKKFINDFSTYYLLAKNIDVNRQFLLKNIPFFAIMLVIKQKWNFIEEQLVQVPKLIDNSSIDDETFYDFISKVAPLIPQPLPSLLPFVYLKETTNEQFINEKLKNGEVIEGFNENIYKRIKTEIENIIASGNELYILQAANSSFATLIKSGNIDASLTTDFIKTIGKIVSCISNSKDFTSFILKNKENVKSFYENIASMNSGAKNTIKTYIIYYLQEKQDLHEDIQKELFSLIIQDKANLFESQEIESIFSEIETPTKITKNIQNYVKLAFKNNRQKFISQDFIDLIINSITTNGFSEQTKTCLNYFTANQLSNTSRQALARKTNDLVAYINAHIRYGTPDITNAINNATICLNLLYKNDFSDDIYQNTMNNLYSILEQSRISTDNARKEYSYELLIEMFWFVDDEIKFSSLLRQFTDGNKDLFVSKMKNKNFTYIEEVFKYNEIQKILLNDIELANSIYTTYSDEIPSNYMLFLCKDCNIKNLENLLNIIKEKDININKIKLRDDIVQKYKETNKIPLIINAFKTLDNYGYNITKGQYLDIKNKLIDFYKAEPKEGVTHLSTIKECLSAKDYSINILTPIFKYIKLELDAANSVANYANIVQVVNETFINDNFDLIGNIIDALSDDNQDLIEYELCLGLVQLSKEVGKNISAFKDKLEKRKNEFNEKLLNIFTSLYPTKKEVDENKVANKN